MASIPLPALDIRPPAQQPGPLEQYGQLLQLRNEAQMAPLRQQAAQQQVQGGALSIQQQQQQLNDQKAMTAAMQQWDGKDLNELPPLVLKNGGSATAVMGLKQKQLEMATQYSTIAKNDADAGTANMATMKQKNDMISGTLSTVMALPDEQLPQGLTSAANDLAQRGLLDPQHAQAAAQLAQSGNPAQIRQQLDLERKSYLGQSQIMDEALKAAQTAEAAANTGKANAETNYYQQNGGAPGVSPDTVELNSYLKNNPGKTPQDYVLWKAEHSPTMILQGRMGGIAGTPEMQAPGGGTDWGKVSQRYGMTAQAFDQQAEKYFQTGALPPIGRGSANVVAMNRDLMNRAAELHPNESLAAGSAEYKANANSLKTLQASLDQVSAFEGTATKNIQMLEGLAQKIPDLGSRFANVPVRMISGNMIGTENMAAFKTALAPVQTEAAKILNSANLSGQLSDSARHELQDIVDGNLSYKPLVASLNVLQQDFKNRHDSTQAQIGDIQARLKGAGQAGAAQGGQSTPAAQSNPSDPFAQFGGVAH